MVREFLRRVAASATPCFNPYIKPPWKCDVGMAGGRRGWPGVHFERRALVQARKST